MNTKLTIKPKRFSKHKYIFALQVSDSVKSCLERVFSVTQTNLLHTRHVCHYKKKRKYLKSYGKVGNLPENR